MEAKNALACQKCSKLLELEAPASEENKSPNVRQEPLVEAEGVAVRKKDQKPTVPNFTEDHYAAKATTSKRDTACQPHAPVAKEASSSGPGKFSQFIETTIRLKEILEEDVELDNPLCAQCCDTLIETVDQKVKETEDEIRDQRLYLINLDSKKDEDEEESIEELQAELARLEAEDRKLIQQCDKLKFERDITFRGRDLLNQELQGLEKSLERETRDYARLKNQWFAASHELTSLENQHAYYCHRRNMLNRTNTLKHMFSIECDEQIGVINGFRLGSLATCAVSWQEINFAWGEAVFLLSVLAGMLEFDFKKYVLKPFGDRSRIEMPERKFVKLPLHCSSEKESIFPVKQLFRAFNAGQVAFMECLTLLEGGIRHRFRDFKLRHPISRKKIFEPNSKIGYSIEYDVDTRDVWTKALKCVLANLEQIQSFLIEKGVRTKLAEVPDQND